LSTALAPPVCGSDVSPVLINKILKEFLPILLEKIAELNFRARDISMHTLISIFKHPAAKIGNLVDSTIDIGRMDPNFPSLFVPVDKQQMRIVLARLEILLQLVQEFGYDHREWNWIEPFNLLVVPSLFHSNADIRLVATELVVAFYQLIGEEVRDTINRTENIKPMMLEQINAKLKSVEEVALKNQVAKQFFIYPA
jgi:centrosomal protein CEP104